MPIVFHCEECNRRYRVADHDAGRSANCGTCGSALTVPPPASQSSLLDPPAEWDSPSTELPILDSPRSEAEWTSRWHASIAGHVEQQLGEIRSVLRPRDPQAPAIDILHVNPTPDRSSQVLVTCGLSREAMVVDAMSADSPFAELLIALPPEWNIDSGSAQDPQRFWPIQLLLDLAALPVKHRTWLGPGQIIPNGSPPSAYAEGIGFNCTLVLPPVTLPPAFDRLRMAKDRELRFYGLVPLHPEESDRVRTSGLRPLLRSLDRHGITELLDVDRPRSFQRWWQRR